MFIITFVMPFSLIGQESIANDSINPQEKKLGLGANEFIYSLGLDNIEYDTLIGNVKITQDSFFLFSDKAYVQNKANVEAISNVTILQGDSIEIFGDSVVYNDLLRRTKLFGEVIFKKGDKRLFTEKAEYDINNKLAVYNNGATLMNSSQRLISQKGEYDIDADQAIFRGKVSVRDSTTLLQTDSLKYNLSQEIVYIIAPTYIKTDTTEIYCEGGYYNYKSQEGVFYNNLKIRTGSKIIFADKVRFINPEKKYILTGYPVVNDGDSHARSDTMIFLENDNLVHLIGHAYFRDLDKELISEYISYNLETDEYETKGESEVVDDSGRILKADFLYRESDGTDVAKSNMILKDEKEAVTLYSDMLKSNATSGNYKAYGLDSQPLLVKNLKDDSLFLLSDTLSYIKEDSIEYYTGQDQISFIKGEISGRSERLIYTLSDSSYVFTDKPIIWSDSTQITGDSIIIHLKKGEITSMDVFGNAFLIMQNANGTYDQVKGDIITSSFIDNKIDQVEVEKNVEMVYFMYEENKLTGVNHSLCGGLVFTFANEDIEYLRFKDKPNSTFSKGEIVDTENYNLQGFSWSIENKPIKSSFIK